MLGKKQATELFDEAVEIIQKARKATPEELDKAEEKLQQILLAKEYPPALFYLAAIYDLRNKMHVSRSLFERCISLDEHFVQAYNNLGVIEKKLVNKERALELFRRAKKELDEYLAEKLQEDVRKIIYSDVVANIGSMYIAEGEPLTAIDYLDKAIQYDPTNSTAKWNRSLAILETGDWERGFAEYDEGDRFALRSIKNYHLDKTTPMWNGEKDCTVAVFGEQGIGDEIMFASVLPDMAKDCKILFDSHQRLVNMFRHSFPGMSIYGTRKDKEPSWPEHYNIDFCAPLGNVIKHYRKKDSDFPRKPYIKADLKCLEKFYPRLDELKDRPNIGFSWKGGIKDTNHSHRYIPLIEWENIFDLDMNFISLQYHPDAVEEIEEFKKKTGRTNIYHWKEVLDDYDYTAALLTQMDLIVSVPQSVVHLAGAMGAPVLQLCPKKALWQMGVYGKDMPWYRNVKNLWQKKSDVWAGVLGEVENQLKQMFMR